MSVFPARKKRRISPPAAVERSASPESDSENAQLFSNDFTNQAAEWNLEQVYERRPRKQGQRQESLRLPIKTADGRVERVESPTFSESDDGGDLMSDQDESIVGTSSQDGLQLESTSSKRERITKAKEELARLAALINEDPQEHIGSLRTLADISNSTDDTIKKLALATQFAVYKDIIPGYRIRQFGEEGANSQLLSKDVRKLRTYEQALAGGYQRYVRELGRIAQSRTQASEEQDAGVASAAISCACGLLIAVPHFNFRGELLRIVIDELGKGRKSPEFGKCCSTMEELFREDDDGHASLEAVQILSRMMKAKNYNVDEGVLNLFLHLRLLGELSQRASSTKVDSTSDKGSEKGKKQKEKREFRTKKERKRLRERRKIEEEMKEADAVVSHEQRDQWQAESLKLVFGVYFRILKARSPRLMGPVLEGLVKYAHLINQEFFGDLLEALKDLIRDGDGPELLEIDAEALDGSVDEHSAMSSRNLSRESLLCVITAFALLQGQDGDGPSAEKALNLDLSFFISQLYRTLLPISLNADIELSSKSLHLPDPLGSEPSLSASAKVNVSTTIVLLLRSLQAVLLPANARSVPPLRLAAYSKQILTSSLQLPEKSCLAMLGLMNQVTKMHKRKVMALWNTEERRGDGVYDPLKKDVEGSNPFAATIWEGELLRLHYAQPVREGVKHLEDVIVAESKS